MKKYSTFLKLGVMALFCLAQSVNLHAQTTLISPTGDGGFETGATFLANGWTEVNGATNQWFVGAVSTPSAGANAAYISDNVTGTTYNYTVTAASTVHFWRDITFPAGETNIVLTFKWKTFGEASFDYVTVYSMPTSNTPTVNNPVGAFQSWLQIPVVYPGAVIHCTPPNLNVQAAYQTQTICLPAAYAGTTRRLVFMWSNDPSVGTQPPGSIDEISLVSSLPPTAPANSPTALMLTPVSVSQIDGSFTAAAGSPDAYLTVRYPTGSAPTNPVNGTTYVAGGALGLGTVVSASAATTFSATGLTPSTTYDFYVYSYNSAPCASGPLYKTTAPLFGTASTPACASLAAGTYSVGPTGTYASLTAVTAALANGTAGPVIFELQATYLSTVETFPITFLASPCPLVGGVIVRPQTGATALSITGADATGTINLNGIDNLTFDGRAGGVGASQLTIENTALTGYAVQFINSATFNTIKYCTVKGVNTGTASGVILFSTAVGLPMGNSNNTIDNCDIRDGATTPTNLIYAAGTVTSYNTQNNNITISNCLFHDWFNATATVASAAINLFAGGSDWTITNNSFYQTVARTFTMVAATEQGAIFINTSTVLPLFSFNHTITNNFIGGSAPLCGGAAFTWTGGATGTLTPRMIRFQAAAGAPVNTISNNTIKNIAITTSSAATTHALISHISGNVNIDNNTIGSQTAIADITFTLASTSTTPFFLPIAYGLGATVNTINVTNNNIGGINVSTTLTGAVSFRIIYGQPQALSKVNVSGNTIGGTVANSIRQQTNGITPCIMILNPTVGDIVSNNTIRNITHDNIGVTGSLTGINVQASGGRHTITGNTIFNLTSNSTNIAINNAASVVGLTMTGSVIGGGNISNNTIYNLTNTNATVAGWINGMYFATALFPQLNTTVSKNFVHSINLASATGGMAGIFLPNTGNANVFNNMVRLGIDDSGASITTSLQINGIYKASTGATSMYHNTVYIGGTGVTSGIVNTYAFRRSASPTVGADTSMNNIFYNARSNFDGTGKHYAANLNASASLVENFNDLLADGTGGVLGLLVATDFATLAAWQGATNQDWNSVSSDPKLINPTGSSATVDLHIQPAMATPIEQAGSNLPFVTIDFDMQTRSSLTPVDIGADAGNFVLLDIAAPAIYYTPLIYTCSTGDRTLAGVNITDATGIPLAGALRPRIYYRKNAGAYFSQPGTFIAGNANNSTWDFTIVAADMGGLVATDVVSYYVIAQDNVAVPNIGSYAAGVIATDVNTVTTHPVTPNTYTINATSLSGTYTVGVGGAYTTLTAAVIAYNTACLTGPVLFSLTDLTYPSETFPITINANPYSSAVNTLTIKPAAGNTPSITGTATVAPLALIVLSGADWVTIDGSNGAVPNTICPPSVASRDLTITNLSTSTVSAVIWLQTVIAGFNGVTNNTIKNVNLVGNLNTQTLMGIGMGSSVTGISIASLGAGNNNNSFVNNKISKTQYGIYSQGANLTNKNTGNTINQNLINTVAPDHVRLGGIFVGFEDNVQVSGNNISGMVNTTSPDVFGIALGMNNIATTVFTGNEVTNATVSNNLIGSVVNTGTFSAAGITIANALTGTNTLTNNMISGVFANGTASDFAPGIFAGGGPGSTTRIYNNSVSMSGSVILTGTGPTYALAVGGVQPIVDVRDNILSATGNNGTGVNIAFGLAYTGTTGNYQNLTSNFNDLFVSGVGSAVGVTGSLAATGAVSTGIKRTTLADWQTETGRDGNSFNVLPNFVSGTDLHLVTTSNQCLDGGGTPIAGLTTDIDCQTRNATIPDIGADEFTNPNLFLTISETSGIANDGIICSGTTVTITASGGGTYLWSTGATTAAITVAPTTTTTYTVTITNGTCTDVLTTTITVLSTPSLSTVVTQPTTCVSTDGAINLTVTPAATYTYDWGDLPGTNDPEDRTGLMVGTYNVTVTNTVTGCTASLSVFLTGPGGCDVCPTLPNVSVTPSPTCVNATFTLSSTNLANMGNTYGIIFKSSTVALTNPYTGGTILATVPNSGLTGGGTSASATASIATAGAYFIYAILTPTPTDPTCRPAATTNLTVNALPTPAIAVTETSGTTNNDGTICTGASATLTASGGTTFLWSTGATTAAITVAPVVTTTFTVTVTNANGCSATTTRTITVNPLPTAFTVTGGGSYCLGGPGLVVGLSGSQTGVNYQLQFNAVNTGAPVAGTGAAFNFPIQTAVGTYTVVATSTTTACSSPMTGSVSIATFNCTVVISDPCICKNNATTLTNGQFDETIKVNAPNGQTWSVSAVNGLYQQGSPAPPAAPLPISTGTALTPIGNNMYELRGVHVDAIGYTVTVVNQVGVALTIGNSCQYPNPAITSDLNGDFCIFSDLVVLTGTPGDNNIVSQGFTVNGVATTTFNPGNGLGQYTITYTVNGGVPKAAGPNDPGCIQSVSQIVNVIATPSTLVCNDLVYVSLDADCTEEILPDDVLEGTYGCFDDYFVELDKTPPYGNGPWVAAILTADDIGKTYQVRVTHLVSGTMCWGNIKAEDKLPPALVCTDITLHCAVTTYTPSYLDGVLDLPNAYPDVTEGCGNFTQTYIDTWHDLTCGQGFGGQDDLSAYVERMWTVTDGSGNSATCIQYLYFERKHITDVLFPADVTLNCNGNVNTNPSSTGAPYLNAFGQLISFYPSGTFCELQAAFVDQLLPVCDGTYKILRTWTVVDWCLPTSPYPPTTNPLYYIQVIKVVDEQGPAFTCPADVTVSTDPFSCCATTALPDIIVEDACSRINNATARIITYDFYTGAQTGIFDLNGSLTTFPGNNLWEPDTLAVFGLTSCLPLGEHTVTYQVEDDCGNTSTCSFELTVDDQSPPSVACDEFTQVALGINGMAFINAETFDDGSFDNCSSVHFKARRMTTDGCQSSNQFHDDVKFCCSDINDTITVILRVYDVNVQAGDVSQTYQEQNSNDCMVQVFVEDKIKPTCVPPGNVTVSCEAFDPSLWAYGTATSADNCCLDTVTKSVNYNQFDTVCNRGTITRTFRAFDCAGNSSQCTQRIIVTYEQDYYVRFPNDVIVTVCDGTGSYGAPTFFGGQDCELLGVSFEDEVFTVVPDACLKIERTWTVINWCTYNPDGTCVLVPNPNPNATVNHPTNLPGPIVSPITTPGDPWRATVVSITPGAPQTSYTTFYNPSANCYQYKQIIKILDGQDPIVSNCPASPVTYCDLSANDPDLWDQPYWWDGSTESHDLCEGDAPLTITATDSCSGANLNITYLLFLDTDNNGTMETVVNSNNPPAPGTVNYNNAGNPNYSGGTPQVFDGRPVTFNNLWRWAAHQSVAGTARTASVQWKTAAQLPTPAAQFGQPGVPPQLPHGTHKIKWTVTDGCGNETYCEYIFVVKDCKAPTVVCLNGLSVNIMPTGMIQVWAVDFLQYAEDNCTPVGKLKYAIRKAGTGTGFPVDALGNPITSVTFTCLELGEQSVELWAMDLAGNASYCVATIDVQDPGGANCAPGSKVTVAGVLQTEADQGLEDADVNLQATSVNGSAPLDLNDATDAQGEYMFQNIVPKGADYTVTPTKDDNPLNGVSTFDLVLISKHILGLEPLNSPYKMICADANKSNSITTFDIVEIRKLILGIYTEFPNNTSWRFADKDFVFPNPSNPFQTQFPETISVGNVQFSHMDDDFVAMKTGDVNGTALPNSLLSADDRAAGTLLFDVDDRQVKAGEEFDVTFKAAEKTQGWQFTVNLAGLEVADIVESDKVKASNFGVFKGLPGHEGTGALTTSVDLREPEASEFTVRFRAVKPGRLSEMLGVSGRITRAEAYPADGGTNQRLEVAFRFNNGGASTVSGVGFELYQNRPNPFTHRTVVGFHLPEAAEATLTVFDETGRVLFAQKGQFGKGQNAVPVERALLENTTGVLWYKVETQTDSATKMMIQTK